MLRTYGGTICPTLRSVSEVRSRSMPYSNAAVGSNSIGVTRSASWK
jgi:hypothetical protein